MAGEPTLRYGDVDKDGWVANLQGRLAAAGFSPGAIDGYFGDATFGAVTGFQSANALVVDGIVGNQTWAALTGAAAAPPGVSGRPGGGGGGSPQSTIKILDAGYDASRDIVFFVAQNVGSTTRAVGTVHDVIEVFAGGTSVFAQNFTNAEDLSPNSSYGNESVTVTGGQAGSYDAWVSVDVDGFSESLSFEFTVGDGGGGDGAGSPPIVNAVAMSVIDAGYDAGRDVVYYVAQNQGAVSARASTLRDIVEVTEDGASILSQNFSNDGDIGPGGSYANLTIGITGGQAGTYQAAVTVDADGFADTLVFLFTVGGGDAAPDEAEVPDGGFVDGGFVDG